MEIWKETELKGVKVSNYGDVKVRSKYAKKFERNEYVVVYHYEAKETFFVHELIAKEFLPNDDPENKTVVVHRDGNTLCNHICNLKWEVNDLVIDDNDIDQLDDINQLEDENVDDDEDQSMFFNNEINFNNGFI